MTVSFHLSPDQEQLKLGARRFAEEHLRPLAAEVRKEPDPLRRALLARPTFEKAVAAGFLKGLIPAPFGGADQAAAYRSHTHIPPQPASRGHPLAAAPREPGQIFCRTSRGSSPAEST